MAPTARTARNRAIQCYRAVILRSKTARASLTAIQLLPGQRDSRHTWRSFWPWAALFARAEAAAGIFPRSRLADGQKSSPIFVVYPTVRVVSSRSPPIKLFRAGECDVNVSKPARQSGAWQRAHSPDWSGLRAGAQRATSKSRHDGRWRPLDFKALTRSHILRTRQRMRMRPRTIRLALRGRRASNAP